MFSENQCFLHNFDKKKRKMKAGDQLMHPSEVQSKLKGPI